MPTNLLDSQDVRAEKPVFLVNIMEIPKLNTRPTLRPQVTATCITYPQLSPTVNEVRVGMAEMRIENKPIELVTSVGSCVALCIYDSANRCGGLAHIMLPNSAIAPQDCLPGKFADTAVPALAKAVREVSGQEACLSAKIAGGANIFSSLNGTGPAIGVKNTEAVKAALNANKIRLAAEDVGGSYGRRVAFNVQTGVVVIRFSNGEIKKL
ncbi:MAG: chemotaxis protein CheD [Candidatus Bathyarchaeota archaeon]|nr:chemotaxis protein CheD [Candidatus Bathyarchaeota archaeon]